MVLTTLTITNARTAVKTKLTTDFTTVAFGSGTTTEAESDTSLQTETLQQAIQEQTTLADRVIFSGFAGAGQLNGTTINETGFKDALSGNLLQRKVLNTGFTKTITKEFWTDLVIIPIITQE